MELRGKSPIERMSHHVGGCSNGFTIPVATRAVILEAAVTQAILVVAEVVVKVRSKEVLPVAVLLQHPVPAQPLPVVVVLHPVQAPTPPWPSRVLKTRSE